MNARVLSEAAGAKTFVVVFSAGETVTDTLLAFARTHQIEAASFTGIRALESVTLGYFESGLNIDVRGTRRCMVLRRPQSGRSTRCAEPCSVTRLAERTSSGEPCVFVGHDVEVANNAILGGLNREYTRLRLKVALPSRPFANSQM
jgi:hypothetical protein